MEAILQRSERFIRQRVRRNKLLALERIRQAKVRLRREDFVIARDWRNNIKYAEAIHKQQWELGPLAPRVDIGPDYDKYGFVPTSLIQRVPGSWNSPKSDIRENERVVVLVGRDRGKIGRITRIDNEYRVCTVENLNKAIIKQPDWAVKATGKVYQTVELPYKLSDVRLVHRLGNRDVIVENREYRVVEQEEKSVNGEPTMKRIRKAFIPGTNTPIITPEKSPEEFKKHDSDTEIIDVEEVTEYPQLSTLPMPPTVIDELRGKYSRCRTRHTPDYIAQKEQEAAEQREQKRLREWSVLTPIEQFAILRRVFARRPVLTDDMLERLGRIMITPPEGKRDAINSLTHDVQSESISTLKFSS